MQEKIKTLKEWIDNSNNIVFFGGAGVSTKAAFLILEVWMVYIIKNMTIRRKRF